MSGLEQLKNSGKEAFINWLDARMSNLEKSLQNNLATTLYSDGTTSKEIGGLRHLIQDDPTTSSTVGGINQATFTFWRNQVQEDQATVSSSNIQGEMNLLWLATLRGADKPHLIMADTNFYNHYETSLQQLQRFMKADSASAGFEELAYKSARVVYDDQCPTNRMYFINCDYLYLRPHVDRQFVPLIKRESINQDAFTIPVVWAGNLTVCNRELQGVLKPT
jgi:hypothetical protein